MSKRQKSENTPMITKEEFIKVLKKVSRKTKPNTKIKQTGRNKKHKINEPGNKK